MRWLPLCGETIHFLASCYWLANICKHPKKYSQPLFWGDTPRSWFRRALQHRVRDCAQEFYFSSFKFEIWTFSKVSPPIPAVFTVFPDVWLRSNPHSRVQGTSRPPSVRSGSSSPSPCRPRCISRFGTESPTAAGRRGRERGELVEIGWNHLRSYLQTLGDVSDWFSIFQCRQLVPKSSIPLFDEMQVGVRSYFLLTWDNMVWDWESDIQWFSRRLAQDENQNYAAHIQVISW